MQGVPNTFFWGRLCLSARRISWTVLTSLGDFPEGTVPFGFCISSVHRRQAGSLERPSYPFALTSRASGAAWRIFSSGAGGPLTLEVYSLDESEAVTIAVTGWPVPGRDFFLVFLLAGRAISPGCFLFALVPGRGGGSGE